VLQGTIPEERTESRPAKAKNNQTGTANGDARKFCQIVRICAEAMEIYLQRF
jgi:hypothetical protein